MTQSNVLSERIHWRGTAIFEVIIENPSMIGDHTSEWRIVSDTGETFGPLLLCQIDPVHIMTIPHDSEATDIPGRARLCGNRVMVECLDSERICLSSSSARTWLIVELTALQIQRYSKQTICLAIMLVLPQQWRYKLRRISR